MDTSGGFFARRAIIRRRIILYAFLTIDSLGRYGGGARSIMSLTSVHNAMGLPPLSGGQPPPLTRGTPGAARAWDRGLTGTTDGLSCPYIFCLTHYGNRQRSDEGPGTLLWISCPALPYRSVPCADLVRLAPHIFSAGVLRWASCGRRLL